MSWIGIHKRLVPEDTNAGRSVEELEADAEKWGRLARESALDGTPASAQFAREARAAALTELRARG